MQTLSTDDIQHKQTKTITDAVHYQHEHTQTTPRKDRQHITHKRNIQRKHIQTIPTEDTWTPTLQANYQQQALRTATEKKPRTRQKAVRKVDTDLLRHTAEPGHSLEGWWSWTCGLSWHLQAVTYASKNCWTHKDKLGKKLKHERRRKICLNQ